MRFCFVKFIFGLFFYFISQHSSYGVDKDVNRPKNLPDFPELKNINTIKEEDLKEIEEYPFVINEVQENFIRPREFDVFIYQIDGSVFYTKYARYNPNGVKTRDRVKVNLLNNMSKADVYSMETSKTYRTRIMAPTTLTNLNNNTEDEEGIEYYQHLKDPKKYEESLEHALKKNANDLKEESLNPYQIKKQQQEKESIDLARK